MCMCAHGHTYIHTHRGCDINMYNVYQHTYIIAIMTAQKGKGREISKEPEEETEKGPDRPCQLAYLSI